MFVAILDDILRGFVRDFFDLIICFEIRMQFVMRDNRSGLNINYITLLTDTNPRRQTHSNIDHYDGDSKHYYVSLKDFLDRKLCL